MTPLHIASQFSDITTVRFLLDNYCNPNIKNKKGYAALYYILKICNTKSIEKIKLLSNYTEIDFDILKKIKKNYRELFDSILHNYHEQQFALYNKKIYSKIIKDIPIAYNEFFN